ncbi:putative glycosyl transferase [Phaeomoniella chlamydospora]|uniref:Putative glycosyl transferase n=1 Tax=Phaeomoniella chlamydospora TaxID=158046 RepID=A0A0G2HHV9_PHACM|nr:putative glycosyl transferase [Phaeomoniella chlamydospora]
MTAIAEVALLMTEHNSLDREPLMNMLEETFPWWIQSKPIYTPWNSKGFKKGSSLIMTVGSGNAQLAASLIVGLRNVLKSKIPIEIAYASNHDLPLPTREKLRGLGSDIHMIDMTEVFDDDYIRLSRGGYAMKPFAMLASQYEKTILVDADVVFFESPDNLFSTHPGLIDTGTLFYHDRSTALDPGRLNWIKELLEAVHREPSPRLSSSPFYNGETSEEADSGLVAVDKSRPHIFMALMFTAWMNTRVRDQVTYQHIYGDKETYWLAPELMGIPYFFQPYYAGNVGVLIAPEDSDPENLDSAFDRPRLCSRQMLHMDANGTTPFWVNGGLYFDKAAPHRGYAEWTHWYIGAPNEILWWTWEVDQYEAQWACLRPPLPPPPSSSSPDDQNHSVQHTDQSTTSEKEEEEEAPPRKIKHIQEFSSHMKKVLKLMVFETEKIEGLIPEQGLQEAW